MTTQVSCPRCERIIMDQQDDGSLRIRTRLVIIPVRKEALIAICPQCKQHVHLPLKLLGEFMAGPGNFRDGLRETKCPQ